MVDYKKLMPVTQGIPKFINVGFKSSSIYPSLPSVHSLAYVIYPILFHPTQS